MTWYRPACGENALLMVTLEFLQRRANCIFMNPAFDYQDIGVHPMRYGQEWISLPDEHKRHKYYYPGNQGPATP